MLKRDWSRESGDSVGQIETLARRREVVSLDSGFESKLSLVEADL